LGPTVESSSFDPVAVLESLVATEEVAFLTEDWIVGVDPGIRSPKSEEPERWDEESAFVGLETIWDCLLMVAETRRWE
jgi:hypothetical protein